MTSEEYFAKRNGGKTPQQMADDREFVGAKWCQQMMTDFAKHKVAEQSLRTGQVDVLLCGNYN